MRKVLEEQLRLNAGKLIDRTLEETSLLALAIGQKYLPAGEHFGGADSEQSSVERNSPSDAQSLILTKLDEILKAFEAGVGTPAQHRKVKGKPSFPTKRDTILFAAIISDLEGLKYCSFLDSHRVKPKWSETGPKSYRESYVANGSYKKKVQDEKCRAKHRMDKYPDSVLRDALITQLPEQFDALTLLLNSRNSRDASKS